ncbi:MAG: hypothetical protein C0483_12435 [Pirellula sp.]|nr:hypothetical protein [Pirellula sp.]
MISKRFMTGLLSAVLGLPIVVLVCLGVGRLLAATGDEGGATLVRRFALLGGTGWLLALIGLVVALAAAHIAGPHAEPIDVDELDELEG